MKKKSITIVVWWFYSSMTWTPKLFWWPARTCLQCRKDRWFGVPVHLKILVLVCQSVTYRRAPFLYFLFTILVELLDQSIYSPPCLSSDFYFYNTTCISIYIGTFSMGGALRVVKLGFSWNWRLLGEKIERPCSYIHRATI